jgi:hypothetical protein
VAEDFPMHVPVTPDLAMVNHLDGVLAEVKMVDWRE